MMYSNNRKKKLKGVNKVVNENHRRKLNETSWVDLGSGNRPTNSTAQTFGLVDGGLPVYDSNFNQVTATFGGLGGVESLPSQVTYLDMELQQISVDPPTYNQLAVAGFAKPLGKYSNFIRKTAAKKASQINDQLDASEQATKMASGADALMKGRVEEANDIYNDLMKKYEAEKKAVDEYNKNLEIEYEKEKERVRVYNEKIMFQHHKTMSGMTWDSKRKMGIPDIDPDNAPAGSDLGIQNRLNAKYMKNGVMTITHEKWAKLHDEMGGKANEETRARLEKKIKPDPAPPTYKNYPPHPDYPDVYDDSIWNDGLNSSTNEVTPSKKPLDLDPIKKSSTLDYFKGMASNIAAGIDVFVGSYLNPFSSNETIDRDRLGTRWMNDHFFPNVQFSTNKTIVKDDVVIGSGQPAKYNSSTGMIEVEATFDFTKNPEELQKAIENNDDDVELKKSLNKLHKRIGAEYGLDAIIDPLGGFKVPAGIAASWLISLMQQYGGGEPIPIKIEITPKELKKKNPIEYDQLVFFGIIPKEVDQNLKEGKTFKNFMSSINN